MSEDHSPVPDATVTKSPASQPNRITEKAAFAANGGVVLLILVVVAIAATWAMIATAASAASAKTSPSPVIIVGYVIVAVVVVVCLSGLVIVTPNVARAVMLFGSYHGTLRKPGLSFTVPLTDKPKVSVKVRNFETGRIKVNDASGNPIEIGAVVVWQVRDTAEALFSVDDYSNFVEIQSETALRHVAGTHPYDTGQTADTTSLRASTQLVSEQLAAQIDERVNSAGVDVVEARITHLAYAPEIAGAMLQRQQASAIVDARSRIVEGAVGMAQAALKQIDAEGIAELTPETRARIVANLLLVLASDRGATPVLPTSPI